MLRPCDDKCVRPLAGSSKSAKVMYISRGIRTCQCPDVVRVTRDQYVVDYAAAWEAGFVYDTIIFILTVAETWKWRQGISGERIGLVQLMFRDGRFYSFLVFVGRFIDLFVHRCFILCVSLAFVPISMANASKCLNHQVRWRWQTLRIS